MYQVKLIIRYLKNRIEMFEHHLEEIKLGKMNKEYKIKNEIGLKECKNLLDFINK